MRRERSHGHEPAYDRKRRGRATAWTTGLIVCLLGAYATTYLIAARVDDSGYAISRIFESPLVARLFIPAAFIESKAFRKHVYLQTVADDSDPSLVEMTVEYYSGP